MSVAFSNDGSHITQAIERDEKQILDLNDVSVDDFFEIPKSIEIILNNDYKKIALQFPDELLNFSVAVATRMRQKLEGRNVFILGDTTYGSCCVDEVTAEHATADFLIHYGHACLTPVERIPVLFVFCRREIDTDECVTKVAKVLDNNASMPILLFYDVSYAYASSEVAEKLSAKFDNVVHSTLSVPDTHDKKINTATANAIEKETDATDPLSNQTFGRKFELKENTELSDYTIVYIGSEGLTLSNLIINYNKCQFCTYDPITHESRMENVNVNRMLMKRFYLIQKAKDASIVGIILGTLGSGKYVEILEYLKKIIAGSGKKSYVFMLGSVNELKVANFLEIDIFVLVACPENSFLDSKEFFRPVVTPFEMSLACVRGKEWTGDFVTDFHEVLPKEGDEDEKYTYDSDEEPDFSLLTGQYRIKGRRTNDENSTALSTRDTQNAVVATASDFLATRSYQGLEQALGETEVKKAVEGTTGIAKGYTRIEDEKNGEETVRKF